MADERWNNPFKHSLAYYLFIKHFTELNDIYWSHIPARNTILKQIKDTQTDEKRVLDFFVVQDKDDKRIATTFSRWKSFYSDFDNYTRLNMLMLLSSSFETYLRTIISLSVESKPGLLLKCPEAIDGVFLLKQDVNYGNYSNKNYQFNEIVEEICVGTWQQRVDAYKKYFVRVPEFLLNNISELDELRRKRNEVGHFLGREKQQYEIPLLLKPQAAVRISHEKLLKYFSLVHKTVNCIDNHLLSEFIGSYDIIKYYRINIFDKLVSIDPGVHAKELQKHFGYEGFMPAGAEYYKNLISYYNLDDKDQQCRYSSKVCIKEIRKRLIANNINLILNGKNISFNSFCFSLLLKHYKLRENSEYCIKGKGSTDYYLYSSKAIEYLIDQICLQPSTIIGSIINNRNGSTQ